MLKIKSGFYFWVILSLICMAAIFVFSSQTSAESSKLSGSVTKKVIAVMDEGKDHTDKSIIETFGDIDTLGMAVRKTAHIFIYLILSICVTKAAGKITDSKLYIFLIALITCSFFAATDEWHQYFIPGRSCRWQDWLIDTIGVLLGIGAVAAFTWANRIIDRILKKSK